LTAAIITGGGYNEKAPAVQVVVIVVFNLREKGTTEAHANDFCSCFNAAVHSLQDGGGKASSLLAQALADMKTKGRRCLPHADDALAIAANGSNNARTVRPVSISVVVPRSRQSRYWKCAGTVDAVVL
jgi:hypothetical protein